MDINTPDFYFSDDIRLYSSIEKIAAKCGYFCLLFLYSYLFLKFNALIICPNRVRPQRVPIPDNTNPFGFYGTQNIRARWQNRKGFCLY